MKLGVVIRKDFLQLFFVVLSFTLMVVVSYHYVSGIVEKQISSNAQENLKTAELSIRSDFREVEAALFSDGLLIEEWLERGESIDTIKSYLSLITEAFNTEGSLISGILDIYCCISETLISGNEWQAPDGYIIQERDWYKAALKANGGFGLTSPYIDNETGKTIITVSKTLRSRTGETIGIIALDIDFFPIKEYIENLHSEEGGYGILSNEEFIVVAHPFSDYINISMEDTNPEHARTVSQLREKPGEISSQRMVNRNGVQMVLLFKKLFNGWNLGIAIPVAAYYRDVDQMALTLSGLGLAFMIILSFILIQLSLSKARSDEENMEKSSFLARMSHEIRTPMNSILGMAELIQRKAISTEIQEYIEIVHQSGDNLLAIINDILDFSKIESGRLQIQNRNYYISSVLNDMINMIRPRVAEKSLDFFVNVDSNIPCQLFGDDMRLRQILTNLLSNAVKYTHRGFISLNVEMELLDNNSIRLICSVNDSGIGIKQEDQKKLFNEFARMDTKINQGIEGTGLGLAITRALCRAMDGDVRVSSEYGKGSNFIAEITQEFDDDKPVAWVMDSEKKRVLFYDWRPQYVQSIANTLNGLNVTFNCSAVFYEFLGDLEHGDYDYAFISSKYAMDCIHALGKRENPLQLVIMVEPGEISVYKDIISIQMPVYSISMANVLNDMTEGVSQDKNPKIHFTAPSAQVLIVDDISTNLRVAKELMSPYNMIIHTCLSGSESLKLVKENYYDLVFMDHMMPGMDGIEATSFIRSLESGDEYFKKLPIIALTANALSGQREMFLQQGINDFLAKPIDIQKLNEILEKWLPEEKRVELSVPQGVGEKHETIKGINIPGVNVAFGIRNCGGGIDVYLNILADFCKDAEGRLEQISETIINRDTKLYITLVHALKGAARSIGAMETGDKASWLEKAAGGGDLTVLKDKTNDLQENLRLLTSNIKAALGRHEAEDKRARIDISALKLDLLTKALSDMDIEAVNRMLLEYASLSLDAKTKSMIAEVEQYILMFEYDKAIEKINELF